MTQSLPRFTQSQITTTATPVLFPTDAEFIQRHIGPQPADIAKMLAVLGVSSLAEAIELTVPAGLRLTKPLAIAAVQSEYTVLNKLKEIATKNQVFRSYIGMGYANCITPTTIQRNILENPGWYTQYTSIRSITQLSDHDHGSDWHGNRQCFITRRKYGSC